MLDDLAISYQRDCDKNREQLLSMENSYETKLKALESKLDVEKVLWQIFTFFHFIIHPLLFNSDFFMTLGKKPLENIEGKGENPGNHYCTLCP